MSKMLQIGVMGSAADLKYSTKIEKIAKKWASMPRENVPAVKELCQRYNRALNEVLGGAK